MPTLLCTVLPCAASIRRSLYGCDPSQLSLLNARPERTRFEAQIIAQAGLPGAVSEAGRNCHCLLWFILPVLPQQPKGWVRLALCLPPLPAHPARPAHPALPAQSCPDCR